MANLNIFSGDRQIFFDSKDKIWAYHTVEYDFEFDEEDEERLEPSSKMCHDFQISKTVIVDGWPTLVRRVFYDDSGRIVRYIETKMAEESWSNEEVPHGG